MFDRLVSPCEFSWRCEIRTVWHLRVADGGHRFQGRFQRQLSVGNHRAEGGRLLCGDLHGKQINRRSRTQRRARAGHKQDSTGKGTDNRDKEDMNQSKSSENICLRVNTYHNRSPSSLSVPLPTATCCSHAAPD